MKKQIEIQKKKNTSRDGIRKELQMLAQEQGDMLTPRAIVVAARDTASPLHRLFEWDNDRAGERYRVMQAGVLLNSIKIEWVGEKRNAYVNARVTVMDEPVRGYFPIHRVASEQELYQAVLEQAVHELEYTQRKYQEIRELRGIIDGVKLQQLKRRLGK